MLPLRWVASELSVDRDSLSLSPRPVSIILVSPSILDVSRVLGTPWTTVAMTSATGSYPTLHPKPSGALSWPRIPETPTSLCLPPLACPVQFLLGSPGFHIQGLECHLAALTPLLRGLWCGILVIPEAGEHTVLPIFSERKTIHGKGRGTKETLVTFPNKLIISTVSIHIFSP